MKKYLFSITFFLVLFEVGLRSLGTYDVYTEQLGRKYKSYWGHEHQGHYNLNKSNVTIHNNQTEFTTVYNTNAYGMRNPEISPLPKDSAIRILCFGDSFTEGDGASNGFSWPRQLEQILNKESNQIFEVINIGKNGSDIIYFEKILNDLAFSLKPKLVLIALNVTDIGDIIQRGGIERFKKNNVTQYKEEPWFEKHYAKSHIVRFITHAIFKRTPLLISRRKEKHERTNAKILLEQSMLRLKIFCDEKNINLRFIIHTTPDSYMIYDTEVAIQPELNVDGYTSSINTKSQYNHSGKVFDLNEFLIDTLRKLPHESFAWQVNGHFNDDGYKIMAEGIYQCLQKDSLFNLK